MKTLLRIIFALRYLIIDSYTLVLLRRQTPAPSNVAASPKLRRGACPGKAHEDTEEAQAQVEKQKFAPSPAEGCVV